MVFGTLQGEVVVINHETDKVLQYVQSIGAPHSIRGLFWLNMDPNKLNSVHKISTDEYFVASGYSNHVGLYDLHMGERLQVFSDLDKEHNMVKFANHSPDIVGTSFFDKEIKMWDLRQKVTGPPGAT